MLAQKRSGTRPGLARCSGEDGAGFPIESPIRHRFLKRPDRGNATILFMQESEPFLRGAGRKCGGQPFLYTALARFGRKLIGDQVFALQLAAQVTPEFRFERANGKPPAIFRTIEVIAGVGAGKQLTSALDGAPAGAQRSQWKREQVSHSTGKRNVHALATAAGVPAL